MTTPVSQKTTQSPLDDPAHVEAVTRMLREGATNASVARAFNTSEKSVRRFRKRHDIELPPGRTWTPGMKLKGDDGEITGAPVVGLHMDDPDAMLRERGLEPEDWFVDGATINEWDGPTAADGPHGGEPITYHQAKLHIKRKRPEAQLVAARSDGWIAPDPKPQRIGKQRLIVVVGDQQAPFHDKGLHELFCGWLKENAPDELVSLGDTVDFPTISRHKPDPENAAEVNECIQSGYDLLRDYRASAPTTRMRKLAGNHDERLRNFLLERHRTVSLYGVKQADTPEGKGEQALGPKFLMRLDELKIEYVDPEGPYDLAQINLSPKLAVRHGWIARKGSGTSALDTLEHLGYSVIVGHTHRQSLVYKTTHDIDGAPTTLTAAEAGCMCRVNQMPIDGRRWPNYSPVPDWQQGFSTVTIHPDGLFRIDNATYVNGTLLWRDQSYR